MLPGFCSAWSILANTRVFERLKKILAQGNAIQPDRGGVHSVDCSPSCESWCSAERW